MIPLDDLVLFIEVAHAKKFNKAAKILGIPSSTLSRRISHLETTIGISLFNRTTRNNELTEAGQKYYKLYKPIIEKAKQTNNQIKNMFLNLNGLIRASLPVDFTITYIAPLLPEFCSLYPDITFEFDLSLRKVDLVKEYYDVVIRAGEQSDSNLFAQLLGYLSTYLYASPEYIQTFGEPNSPEELVDHECLGIIYDSWKFYQNHEVRSVPINSKFKINNIGLIRKMITYDMGVALMPEMMVVDEVKKGQLVKIMSPWEGMKVPIYAITETKLLPKKTKVFIEFLKQRLKQSPQARSIENNR